MDKKAVLAAAKKTVSNNEKCKMLLDEDENFLNYLFEKINLIIEDAYNRIEEKIAGKKLDNVSNQISFFYNDKYYKKIKSILSSSNSDCYHFNEINAIVIDDVDAFLEAIRVAYASLDSSLSNDRNKKINDLKEKYKEFNKKLIGYNDFCDDIGSIAYDIAIDIVRNFLNAAISPDGGLNVWPDNSSINHDPDTLTGFNAAVGYIDDNPCSKEKLCELIEKYTGIKVSEAPNKGEIIDTYIYLVKKHIEKICEKKGIIVEKHSDVLSLRLGDSSRQIYTSLSSVYDVDNEMQFESNLIDSRFEAFKKKSGNNEVIAFKVLFYTIFNAICDPGVKSRYDGVCNIDVYYQDDEAFSEVKKRLYYSRGGTEFICRSSEDRFDYYRINVDKLMPFLKDSTEKEVEITIDKDIVNKVDFGYEYVCYLMSILDALGAKVREDDKKGVIVYTVRKQLLKKMFLHECEYLNRLFGLELERVNGVKRVRKIEEEKQKNQG